MLTAYNSSQKVIVHVSESGQKNGLQPAGGQLVKVDTAAKLKREQVLYCALKSALFYGDSGGGGGATVGLLAPAVSLIWLEKRSFPN